MTATLTWILVGGFLMSAIAMVGVVILVLPRALFERLLLPTVAMAAGTLLGGALFHMMPNGMASLQPLTAAIWLAAGIVAFLLLEQMLHWRNARETGRTEHAPVTYLVLAGDTLHNFVGGLGIASTFIVNPAAGVMAWLAAAAHEIPQELGDFAVLVHGGWSRQRALLWNLISALAFPLGAVVGYLISRHLEVSALVLFGAGNFLYIAAADLIPEIKVKGRSLAAALFHFLMFLVGLGLMLALALYFRA